MGEDGIINAQPEFFRETECDDWQDKATGAGDNQRHLDGYQAADKQQTDREHPEKAGDGIIQWNCAQAPSIFFLDGKETITAAIV